MDDRNPVLSQKFQKFQNQAISSKAVAEHLLLESERRYDRQTRVIAEQHRRRLCFVVVYSPIPWWVLSFLSAELPGELIFTKRPGPTVYASCGNSNTPLLRILSGAIRSCHPEDTNTCYVTCTDFRRPRRWAFLRGGVLQARKLPPSSSPDIE
jgi:hypothetical protein